MYEERERGGGGEGGGGGGGGGRGVLVAQRHNMLVYLGD